jgi:signal transduction histidine kinase
VKDDGTVRDDVRVDVLAAEALALARPQAAAAGVSLKADIPFGLPVLRGDALQLQQALVNLLRNGIEAAAAGPATVREVRIAARAAEGRVEVTVADTGPGFAPGVAARLFEPYFTTKPEGMGIGLAIGRAIVESHAGQLRAESETGGGARFTILLPTAPVTEGPLAPN